MCGCSQPRELWFIDLCLHLMAPPMEDLASCEHLAINRVCTSMLMATLVQTLLHGIIIGTGLK